MPGAAARKCSAGRSAALRIRLILADDLTGAADAALALWRPGLRVRVLLPGDNGMSESAHVVARSCEWRDRPDGANRFLDVLPPSPDGLFIKVDSTLRGPVAEMVAACRLRWPEAPLRFCPALPAQGRTVRGGRLYVHGVPQPPPPGLPPMLDAQSDRDLAALAAAAPPGCLWVGSSGLAAALGGRPTPRPAAGSTRGPRVLVVAGSDHPATRAQLLALADPAVRDAAAGIAAAAAYPAWVATGGRTAAAVLDGLGLPGFDILGAAGDGIPWGRAGRWWIATKAGGFGGPDALARTCDVLRAVVTANVTRDLARSDGPG